MTSHLIKALDWSASWALGKLSFVIYPQPFLISSAGPAQPVTSPIQEFQAWLNTRIQFPPRILAMSAEE